MADQGNAARSLAVTAVVTVILLLLLGLAGFAAIGGLVWFARREAARVQTELVDQALMPLGSETAPGAEIDARAESLQAAALQPVVVRCDRLGQMRVDDELLTAEALRDRLMSVGPDVPVTVYVHPECPYRYVVLIERTCLFPAQISDHEFVMDAREASGAAP